MHDTPGGTCQRWPARGDGTGCFMLAENPLQAVCLPTCDSNDDCRDGYSCVDVDDRFACLPI